MPEQLREGSGNLLKLMETERNVVELVQYYRKGIEGKPILKKIQWKWPRVNKTVKNYWTLPIVLSDLRESL
jgi:hypothetical protein